MRIHCMLFFMLYQLANAKILQTHARNAAAVVTNAIITSPFFIPFTTTATATRNILPVYSGSVSSLSPANTMNSKLPSNTGDEQFRGTGCSHRSPAFSSTFTAFGNSDLPGPRYSSP